MAIEITLAYLLDLIFGDPRWFPHPVKGIGGLIKKLEPPLRKAIKNEQIAGVILAFAVISLVGGGSLFIIQQSFSINKYLGSALSIFLIYTSLAVKDLKVESMKVYQALEKKDLVSARKNLSLIVGRDTQNLEDKDIIRATVETISENIVDGIISPLFYAFLGGAPLALAYKTVNTLDSMVGYKNEKYKNFGWASAKIDDWANFIPARLSVLFLPIGSLLAGKDALNSWKIARRDSRKNPSPNSGIPQACVAGALGVQLGGLNFYNSKTVLKPFIGGQTTPLAIKHIKESLQISCLCSALVLIFGVIFTVMIRW